VCVCVSVCVREREIEREEERERELNRGRKRKKEKVYLNTYVLLKKEGVCESWRERQKEREREKERKRNSFIKNLQFYLSKHPDSFKNFRISGLPPCEDVVVDFARVAGIADVGEEEPRKVGPEFNPGIKSVAELVHHLGGKVHVD
jgi:hypothetical protein